MKRNKPGTDLRPASRSSGQITGVPALLMDHGTTADSRAARILGMRPNQFLRSVKDCSNRIYRQAVNHIHVDRNEGLSRNEHDSIQTAVICSDNALRMMLLEEHAKASFSPTGKPERIPVLEYALLKAWKPHLAAYQRGEYGPYRKAASTPNGVSAPRKEALPFFASHVELFFLNVSQQTPWTSEAGFTPFWLIPVADRVLCELASWDELNENEQSNLAGAAYAVSSAVGRAKMLQCYLDVEPRLGIYLQGVCGLTEDDEDWDGSIWTRRSITPAQSQLILGLSELSSMKNTLIEKCDLGTIDLMRQLLDSCEKIVCSVATHAIGDARDRLSANKALLEKMVADLRVTGRSFEFTSVAARIDMWIGILNDARMSQSGTAQTALLDTLRAETAEISDALPALIQRFDSVGQKHQAILAGGLTWQEQAKQMQELGSELDAFEAECRAFTARFEGRERAELVVADAAAAEACIANNHSEELELALAQNAQQAELICTLQEENADLTLRLSGLDSQNDALRQENADLRLRAETLQLALGNGTREPSSCTLPARLVEAVESMIEIGDVVSMFRLAEAMYPGRVRFFDSAYESAARHMSSLPVPALYQRIKALATHGLDRVRETGRLIDLREVVPGDLTTQESDTVKGNAKLRAMRNFRDGNKSRLVYPHLSIDYSHRLYFDYDAEEDLIVVAYAGKHFPSAKNATV